MSQTSPGQPIGVGIIGLSEAGGWAAMAHLPALRELSQYEVRASSASNAERGVAGAKAHNVPVACRDHRELVARDDVDLVVVTVKVPQHYELVSAAIEGGKNVLCEWPLGATLAETEQLAALAERRGVRCFVGLQARAAPAVRFARELVACGAVGRVLSTSVIASGSNWGAQIVPGSSYCVDRANGASMLTIPFGHTADALAWALGEFASLSATTAIRRPFVHDGGTGELLEMTVEDQVAVTGTLGDGVVASLHFRGGMSHGTNFLWEVNGTDGDLVVRGENGHLQFGRVSVETSRAGGGLEHRPVPRSFLATDLDPVSHAHAVAAAYVDIAADLRGESHLAPTFVDAVRRHRMLEAVVVSGREGRRIDLE